MREISSRLPVQKQILETESQAAGFARGSGSRAMEFIHTKAIQAVTQLYSIPFPLRKSFPWNIRLKMRGLCSHPRIMVRSKLSEAKQYGMIPSSASPLTAITDRFIPWVLKPARWILFPKRHEKKVDGLRSVPSTNKGFCFGSKDYVFRRWFLRYSSSFEAVMTSLRRIRFQSSISSRSRSGTSSSGT